MARTHSVGTQAAVLLLGCLLLAACGGKKKSPEPAPTPTTPNQLPVANAGPDQTVAYAVIVTLTGAASSDPDGSIASYLWVQNSGPTVALSSAAAQSPTFQAPSSPSGASLTFTLSVTDNRGGLASDTVTITVTPAPNQMPTANAGPDRAGVSATTITLDGSGSSDIDGSVTGYSWSQAAGPAVTLANPQTATPSFTAPTVAAATDFTFSLTVTDNNGGVSTAADTVTITVYPAGTTATLSGTIRFARIPAISRTVGLSQVSSLDYPNTRQDPARAITVQAINTANATAVASGVTDASGNYSLTVPIAINVRVRAVATMVQEAPTPLPHWNVRVRSALNADDYFYDDTQVVPISAPAGVTRSVQIPSGFSAAGALNGTRSAAPFAILDTVYTAISTVLTASPNADFPVLTIDWATDNSGGQTYYDDNSGGDNRLIVVSGQLNVDTDEYDPHVVAHEYGHYIEDRFSRSDNVGGSHASGQRLHPSVAFGEGFGTAFAAMILGDSVYRDTVGPGQQNGSSINIEGNSPLNPGWWSEASTYSILWDLFDAANDDNAALGFAPIWQVMTGEQRNTDSITGIHSFITYLKQQNGAQDLAINSVVSAHGIVANGIDIYGDTETNLPVTPAPPLPSDILPIFTPITINGATQVVRSIGTYGADLNKLSVVRFLRFDVPTTQDVHVIVASQTANRDANVRIYRRGVLIASGIVGSSDEDVFVTLSPGTYVIYAYDYRNVSGTANATPLNVTVRN